MAALTLTGPVTASEGDPRESGTCSVAIAAGEMVYIDSSSSNQYALADKNTLAASKAVGVAIGGAGIGEDLVIAKPGSLITVANTPFTQGLWYYLGDSGTWVPVADVAASDYPVIIAYGVTTSTARIHIYAAEVTV